MVVADNRDGIVECWQLLKQLRAEFAVAAHHLLFLGRQRARLQQDAVGYGDLSDVVQERAGNQITQDLLVEPERLAERTGIRRNPKIVAACIVVAHGDCVA